MISPCARIDIGAVPQAGDVCYWSMSDFRTWAREAIRIVRSLWTKFPGSCDLEWRAIAMKSYRDAGSDPLALVSSLNSKKLKDLPVVKAQ